MATRTQGEIDRIYKSFPITDRKKLGRSGCVCRYDLTKCEELILSIADEKGGKVDNLRATREDVAEVRTREPKRPEDPTSQSVGKVFACSDGKHVIINYDREVKKGKQITKERAHEMIGEYEASNRASKEMFDLEMEEYRPLFRAWADELAKAKAEYHPKAMKDEIEKLSTLLGVTKDKAKRLASQIKSGVYDDKVVTAKVANRHKKPSVRTKVVITDAQRQAAVDHTIKRETAMLEKELDEKAKAELASASANVKAKKTRLKKAEREISRNVGKKQTRHVKTLPGRRDDALSDLVGAEGELARLRAKLELSDDEAADLKKSRR